MKKSSILLFVFLVLLSLSGCAESSSQAPAVSPSLEPQYMDFEELPENYTPNNALKDGYLVITMDETETDSANLYGGGEVWQSFLADTMAGKSARIRAVSFLSDGITCEDLIYREGKYFYTISAPNVPAAEASFLYLENLTGTLPNAEKAGSVYVLTDSKELTYYDVMWSFLSSSTETVTKIPFIWLFFPEYVK